MASLFSEIRQFTTQQSPKGVTRQSPLARQKQIEADAVAFDDRTETTREKSRYVFPGDGRFEDYRLSTFATFPFNSTPVRIWDMARSGHLYTGVKDRVRCFWCGFEVENWELSDNPLSSMWHATDCDLAFGRDTSNVARVERNVYDLIREGAVWSSWLTAQQHVQEVIQIDPEIRENERGGEGLDDEEEEVAGGGQGAPFNEEPEALPEGGAGSAEAVEEEDKPPSSRGNPAPGDRVSRKRKKPSSASDESS